MGMKEMVEVVAFFIAAFGPLGIGLLVPTRYLAGLLSAAWPVVIGIIMASTYGMPKESVATWLGNIVIIGGMAAVCGLVVFYVKTRWKARRDKII